MLAPKEAPTKWAIVVRMRVHLVCAFFPPFGRGGGPIGSELIARALVASGHEIEVLTATDAPYEDRRHSYLVRSIGSPNVYADLWRNNPRWKKLIWHLLENFNPIAFWRVSRHIRRFRPDIVMTISVENINVATWLAAKWHGVPAVHVAQSHFLLCWRGTMYRSERNCARYCASCRLSSIGKRLAAKCVDAVIGESKFIIRAHRRRSVFTKARTFVIPGPVERIENADATGVPHKPGFLTVGYIGNISQQKGILTIARAARRVQPTSGERIRFIIAGTGKDDFMSEVRSQFPPELTTFTGWLAPDGFYREVDAVIVPSLMGEPFGRVSIEPLAYGVPVIVARSGGLPENIEEGVSGLVFSPDDDERLSTLLIELASNPARLQALSRGARARAIHYEFSTFARKIDRAIAETQPESVGSYSPLTRRI